jgi:AraC-like DNA-binding protein
MFRLIVGDAALAPLEVRFAHAAPADARRHRALFGAPVTFGAARHALVLGRAERARAATLEHGPPPLTELARALGTSARTLQRRLAELGVDYQQIIDEVRCARTLELLQKPSLSVLAVARAVGHADASSFHRAFRRWTGSTPGAYREASARTSDRWTAAPAPVSRRRR